MMRFGAKAHPVTGVLWILCLTIGLVGCSEDNAPVAPAGDPLLMGLAAHYSFDSDASDSSPNGQDGTLLGNATANGSLVIGSNDTNALSLPASIVDGLVNFSFAGWVKLDVLHVWPSQWISGATATEDNNLGIWYDPNNHNWAMCLFGNTTPFPTNSAMEDNQWHHIVVIRSGTNARLYVDGFLATPQINVSADPLDVDNGGFIIGQDQDSLGGGFQTDNSLGGEVDELRIYNRALNASEVSSLHSKGH